MIGATLLGWVIETTIKGSIVIVLIALVQRLIAPRVDARWRHALWLVVVLRLAAPIAPASSWSIFNLLPAQPSVPLSHVAIETAPLAPMFVGGSLDHVQLHVTWWADLWKWFAAIWIGGVLAVLLRAIIATIRVHIAVKRAGALDCAATLEVVDEARRRLGIARPVRVVESNIVGAPALHGLFRPTLVLPRGLTASFDRDELRHVVLHELWHLRRLDVAINWLLAAVQAIHWFNPFVWFAVARIQEERELACDELALSCLDEDERFGYGRTILKLLERFCAATPVPALVGIVNHKQKMKRRLIMIATFKNRSRFSLLFLAALSVIGIVGLTDARGGERHMLHRLDPAAAKTFARLDQRLSFDLTNASLGELLNIVSNKTGVAVVQSADLATSDAQQARFTVHAENVPAHAVLMEALMPFSLIPEPDANGVTIASGPSCMMMTHHGAGKMVTHDEEEKETVTGAGDKRVVVRSIGPNECKITADGTLHRELTINIEENGVKSDGKLIIDVSGVQTRVKE